MSYNKEKKEGEHFGILQLATDEQLLTTIHGLCDRKICTSQDKNNLLYL